jgi:hypothetical protein
MLMSNLRFRIGLFVVALLGAFSVLIAPALLTQSVGQANAAPCYPGFVTGNPYIPSCNTGPRLPRVRGGPPDQAAVIACRDIPGCLSWYINHPH